MTTQVEEKKYSKKDFQSDQAVRWCPGCGDYAILTAIQNTMPMIGRKKEDIVFISGIGCSSRFPYYMNTYGFHTIHGRAPAIAMGTKVANPNLDVWVISGDGDSYSIGGNHFIHCIRRNLDVKYIIFNNEIYGLTKGQYSPTSNEGLVTKSTPYGSLDHPFNPAMLALGAGCTFYARVADTSPKEMKEVFLEAAKHKGTAIVEVLQNCVIFNDGVHKPVTERDVRDDHQLKLEAGKPMIFGKENNKGIVLDGVKPKVVTIGEDGVTEADILVHNPGDENPTMALLLAQMKLPDFPVPMGVYRSVSKPTYEQQVDSQVQDVKKSKAASLQELLKGKNTWTVK